jgi:hypothetical protein
MEQQLTKANAGPAHRDERAPEVDARPILERAALEL